MLELVYFYRKFIASYVRTYTSYVATILSSMCMDYVSLAWIDSIPHV